MSYLEMAATPLPDMNQGIISLWFRDATKGPLPPPDEWPSGPWTDGTDSMLPPDTQAISNETPAWTFYWNAYGFPLPLFGGLLTGPASVYMPYPPPLPISSMRTLLTFGDPGQPIYYCPWKLVFPDVIPAVVMLSSQGFVTFRMPPPYGPLYEHFGGDGSGLYTVANMVLGPPEPRPNLVPQSFIGVTEDGYLTICLQTNNRASYKGQAYMLEEVKPLMASPSFLRISGPPYSYTEIGLPFPDGVWYQVGPGWWNGYEFQYKDISNEIMGAAPEVFVIGGPLGSIPDFTSGPRVDGPGWHHLLFSFDISGSVHSDQPGIPSVIGGVAVEDEGPPNATTACKAWLAVDDRNYTDTSLQRRFAYPDGFTAALLPGMGHAGLLPFGPVSTYARGAFVPPLGPNDILPQNVWLHGFTGYPRDGLMQYDSVSGVVGPEDPARQYVPVGDFNALDFAGGLWPLYGHGVAPGPWIPGMYPPRPSTPDPKTFDLPTYDCPSFNIPVQGHPIGVPASTHHLEHNTGIEMAELQIWANRTLDTGNVAMRRLFIDENGKPVAPSVAAKVLGTPDVMLHGRGNWKKGINTGTTGVRVDGNQIPTGQFQPTAKIESFKPEPKVGA